MVNYYPIVPFIFFSVFFEFLTFKRRFGCLSAGFALESAGFSKKKKMKKKQKNEKKKW